MPVSLWRFLNKGSSKECNTLLIFSCFVIIVQGAAISVPTNWIHLF